MRSIILLLFFIAPFLIKAQKDPCIGIDAKVSEARTLADQKDFKAARKLVDQLLVTCPDQPSALLLKGDLYLQMLELDSAKQIFRHYHHLNPADAMGLRKLAGVAFFESDYDSSLYYLNKALAINPTDTVALYNKGEVLYYMNEFERAESCFLKVSGMDPSDIQPRLRLCDIWTAQGRIADCWKQVEEMKKTEMGNFDVMLTEAHLLILEKQYDRAAVILDRAQAIDSLESATYFARARLYEETNKYELALGQYNILLTLDGENLDAYLQRGNLLMEMGQNELAQADYKDALSIDSSFAPALHQLGISLYEMTQYEGAIEYFDRYLKLENEDADAYFNRGNSRYALQRFAEAIEDYTAAIALRDQIDYRYNRAICYYSTEQYSYAIRDLNEYLKVESADAEGYYLRGLCYFAESMHEDACMDCKMAAFLGKEDLPGEVVKACKIKKKKKKKSE